MPSTQEHQKKQSRSQLALSELQISPNSSQDADWIVVLAFYKALHAVDSYLATLNIQPSDHSERNRYVQNCLRRLHNTYWVLYRASRRARYGPFTYESSDKDVSDMLNSTAGIANHINSLPSTP